MRENNLDPSMLRRRAKGTEESTTETSGVDGAETADQSDSVVDLTGDGSQESAGSGIAGSRQQRQLKRQQDDSSDDYSDEEDGMDQGDKELKLFNLPPDAGKYPFDSAVEKTMLRLLNCLKQLSVSILFCNECNQRIIRMFTKLLIHCADSISSLWISDQPPSQWIYPR